MCGVTSVDTSVQERNVFLAFCVKNIPKVTRNNAYVLGKNRLAFGEDADYFVDPGSFPGFFTIGR